MVEPILPPTAGRVPNCRRCPQCYFDFNATLYQLLSSVEAETMRVAQFSGVYGNLTIETVEVALASLHTELNGIAVALAGLQVTPSQLDTLNITLMQVCWSPTWVHGIDMHLLLHTYARVGGTGVQSLTYVLSCMYYFRAYVSFMQCYTKVVILLNDIN